MQALIDGLQQAYQNKPLALSKTRMEALLSQHDAQANDRKGKPEGQQQPEELRRIGRRDLFDLGHWSVLSRSVL